MIRTLSIALLLAAGVASAQDVESKMSGNTVSQGFTVKNNAGSALLTVRGDGRVAVGTATPGEFKLTLENDGGFMARGSFNSGASLTTSGAGTRMFFYPRKGAFRAGNVTASEWDDANIGDFSTATGRNTTASGYASTALGYDASATGGYSLALGLHSVASGTPSVAIGAHATANSQYGIAIGSYVSTNGAAGACVIGDQSTSTVMTASSNNQMSMRFSSGYRLYTNGGLTQGVYMSGGASGWTSVSDRNRKEHVTDVDGEWLLSCIRALPVTEWSYRESDAGVRYIGPMAQDFWQAFHLGGMDSLGINSISIDGVNMAAVKALELRTGALAAKTDEIVVLRRQAAEQRELLTAQNTRIDALQEANHALAAHLSELRGLKAELAALRTLLLRNMPQGDETHAALLRSK
ncbi:MAG: tail fiber domain-containing protein [Ignavibacteria bacterium]|nr:tail fiber domain-containing protein [Ignavibacteria bacterium]